MNQGAMNRGYAPRREQERPDVRNYRRAEREGWEWPEPPVSVRALKVVASSGSLRAVAEVLIGPPGCELMVKCRLMETAGKPLWISAPQDCWTDKDDVKHWTPLVVFPRPWLDAVTEVVTAAFYDNPDGFEPPPNAGPARRRW